jgi:hypothetical protein
MGVSPLDLPQRTPQIHPASKEIQKYQIRLQSSEQLSDQSWVANGNHQVSFSRQIFSDKLPNAGVFTHDQYFRHFILRPSPYFQGFPLARKTILRAFFLKLPYLRPL